MNDDLLIAKLRDLPPALAAPGDRMASVRRRVTRRRRTTAGAATLAVALLAGGVAAGFAELRDRAVTPDRPAPACPANPGGGTDGTEVVVPARPGVDTGGRLVPRETPRRAVVCRYALDRYDPAQGQGPTWTLRADELAGGLDRLADDLWWFPSAPPGWRPACALMARSHPVNYLIGLQYPGGTVWVATPGDGECGVTTNGDLVSDRPAGDRVERSLDARTWVPPRATPAADQDRLCRAGAEAGRHGQDDVLVPPAPVELLVCRQTDDQTADGRPVYSTGTLRDGVAEFAAQLSSGRTVPDTGTRGCSAPRGVTATYKLVFRYAEGPPVGIGALIGCDPPLLGATVKAWEAPGTNLEARLEAIIRAG
jgi:hypothetical protein